MKSNAALLLLDVQPGFVERFGVSDHTVSNAARAVMSARSAGLLVVFVRTAFRDGQPERSQSNKALAALAASGIPIGEADPAAQVHPSVGPLHSDIIVTKRRVGAFTGTDLDVVLRSHGITDLVIGGVTTGGVVLSTVRSAADLDYRITVLSDACSDPDLGVHTTLLEKVFPRQAEVTTVSDWSASI